MLHEAAEKRGQLKAERRVEIEIHHGAFVGFNRFGISTRQTHFVLFTARYIKKSFYGNFATTFSSSFCRNRTAAFHNKVHFTNVNGVPVVHFWNSVTTKTRDSSFLAYQ